MKRGWWKGFAQSPLNSFGIGDCPEQGDNIAPEGLEALEEPTEAAEGDDEHGDQEDPMRRISAATARSTAAKRRAACVNTLHFCSKMLASETSMRLWRAMVYLPEAFAGQFGQWMQDLKTRGGTLELFLGLVNGSDVECLRRVFRLLSDTELVYKLGFRCEGRSPAQIKEDSNVADKLWRLAVTFVAEASLSNEFYRTPPQCFLGLLSKNADTKKEWLQRIRCFWEALVKMEASALEDHEARMWLDSLRWPLEQWCRELLVMLAEGGWESVPSVVQEEVSQYSRAHWSTIMIENLGNAGRRASRASPSGALKAPALWHSIAMASPVCADHERPVLSTTAAARSIAPSSVPHGVFKYSDKQVSLERDVIQTLTQAKPSWPTQSAKSLRESSVKTLLLEHYKGEWARVKCSWRSLVLVPGSLVYSSRQKKSYLVLYVCSSGFLAWRPSFVNQALRLLGFGMDAQSSLVFQAIDNFRDWRASSIVIATPSSNEHETSSQTGSLQLRAGPRACKVVGFGALRGFPKMRVYDMKLLYRDLQVEGRMPHTEVALLSALVHHIVPTACDEDIKQALACRGRPTSSETPENLLSSRTMTELVSEELEDEDLKDEIKRLLKTAAAEQRRKEKQVAELEAHLSRLQPSAPQAASSSSSCREDNRAPKLVLDTPGGYTAAQAKRWAPPGCKVFKESKWHRRWRVDSSHLRGVRSKSYGGETGLGDFEAMCFALSLAWHAHTAATGEGCPFAFGAWPSDALRDGSQNDRVCPWRAIADVLPIGFGAGLCC